MPRQKQQVTTSCLQHCLQRCLQLIYSMFVCLPCSLCDALALETETAVGDRVVGDILAPYEGVPVRSHGVTWGQ